MFPVFSAAIITYQNVINYLEISALLFNFSSSYWNEIKTSSDLNFNGRLDKQQIVSPGLNINNVLDYQNKEKYLLLQTYETEAIIVLKLPSLQCWGKE